MKKLAIIIPILLIALIGAVFLSKQVKPSNDGADTSISRSGFYFDTVIRITLYGETDESLIDDCFALCQQEENRLSHTVEGSDIWQINHAKGEPVEVDAQTAKLIEEALSYSEPTGGLFDISVAAASDLWDFDDENAALPDADALAKAVKHIDYRKVHVSGNTVKLDDPDMKITLGGIAKGYIADELKALLKKKGVKRALINLGGNVQAIGMKAEATPFVVGIQYPFKEDGEVIAAAAANDCSLVTSGPYERYIEADGKIYHHILDPKTGYAIDSDLVSVTICCDSSLHADALSTSVYLLGSDKGSELIKSTDNASALLITNDYQLHTVGDFPLIEN